MITQAVNGPSICDDAVANPHSLLIRETVLRLAVADAGHGACSGPNGRVGRCSRRLISAYTCMLKLAIIFWKYLSNICKARAVEHARPATPASSKARDLSSTLATTR
jgi:hypothetical protein